MSCFSQFYFVLFSSLTPLLVNSQSSLCRSGKKQQGEKSQSWSGGFEICLNSLPSSHHPISLMSSRPMKMALGYLCSLEPAQALLLAPGPDHPPGSNPNPSLLGAWLQGKLCVLGGRLPLSRG